MKAEMFIEIRTELMNLARRMLGSNVEAEDMVQEACLRWERADTSEVRSPKAFLQTRRLIERFRVSSQPC
jgi:RNA polymerase sigma-70 factor, ECF subfamily